MIAHFGTEEQRREILPKAARGELLMGIAITEPHAGSGATDMHSRAAIEGDEIVINGHKAYVEDTAAMGSFLVYAKFDDRPGARSMGGVILDKGTPGFRIGPPRKKMGARGCIQADLYLENCRVPKRNLIVAPGEFGKLMTAFNLERCGNAAMAVGIAGAAFDEAVQYAKTRTQFGRLLCEFQGLQWKMARMLMQLDAARLMLRRATIGRQGLSVHGRGFDGESLFERDGYHRHQYGVCRSSAGWATCESARWNAWFATPAPGPSRVEPWRFS